MGLTVIPTVSWADNNSYSFCFKGIEEGSVVAVSTLGIRKQQREQEYMQGFAAMVKNVKQKAVVCYGVPYAAMHALAQIYTIQHVAQYEQHKAHLRQLDGQQQIPFVATRSC